jgi:hypothetical protein
MVGKNDRFLLPFSNCALPDDPQFCRRRRSPTRAQALGDKTRDRIAAPRRPLVIAAAASSEDRDFENGGNPCHFSIGPTDRVT